MLKTVASRSLTRNPDKVKSNLVNLDDGRTITKKGCHIQIPVRYAERGMANIGVDCSILGVYACIFEDSYAVRLTNAFVDIEPTEINKVSIAGDDYYDFYFAPGSTVVKSNLSVKTDSIPFLIYSEMTSKGYIPWYLNMIDLGNIYNDTREHTGANIGQNREVTQLIVSLQCRDKTNKTIYFRSTIEDERDLVTKTPEYIGLRDVSYAPTNTLNRLGGAYFSEAIVASLNNPSERVERIESIMLS